MRLVFDGAEVPSHRLLLERMGVQNFGVSFFRLWRRGLPKRKPWSPERFPGMVFLHPGNVPEEYREQILPLYRELVESNDLAGAVWPEWAGTAPAGWWVVWNHENATVSLEQLASEYDHIALPYATLDALPGLATRTRALSSQHGVTWHALGCAKPDNLRQIPFETASTQAWLAPMLRGETLLWSGTALSRYPKKMKEQATARCGPAAQRAGLDFEAIQRGDSKEITLLAVWSLLQLETRMSQVPSNNADGHAAEVAEQTLGDAGHSDRPGRHELVVRQPSETMPMPVLGFENRTQTETIDGVPTLVDRTHVTSQSQSLRACDTCFIAANCPAYTPHSTCAFSLPVEVKTKEQLKSLLMAIIEMQGQRVAFARFAEEIEGGYPDANLSSEIDRLFKLVQQAKEIEDDREITKITMESRGGGGILAAMFGQQAATPLQNLERPLTPEETDILIRDAIE